MPQNRPLPNFGNLFDFAPHKTKKSIDESVPPEIWSSCTISDDGTVYVASNDGQMWALNPDLTRKWNVKFKYGKRYYEAFATPILAPNKLVIVGNENRHVFF